MTKLTVLMAVVLVAMSAACGDDDSTTPTNVPTTAVTPTPVGTATAVTATKPVESPSATATQQGALPGDMARAIDAVKMSDGSRLGSLLRSTEGPCVVSPRPGILYPPACPTGAPAGTKVPALVFGGCPDEFTYIDPSLTFRVTGFDGSMYGNHLIGVVDLGTQPLRYAALFGFEKVGWLGFDATGKLIGAGGGGDCPSDTLRPRLTANKWLTGPDWGN